MNQGKYVFAQLTEFLPSRVFDGMVEKYQGNRYVKHFTCWNQLLAMIFGQLSNRDSLRDLIVSLDAHSQKSYHLGFGKSVTRSTPMVMYFANTPHLGSVPDKAQLKVLDRYFKWKLGL